ncbi:MAG: hypothetical protein OEY89_13990 [Gammaproteobacteria bacterium]|nr:hypothetical protein [Gammaproteobacteria bacterium]
MNIGITLNQEQEDIILHTHKNGLFCGSSPDMDILVKLGLTICVGKKSFVPDPYYSLTDSGLDYALDKLKEVKNGRV